MKQNAILNSAPPPTLEEDVASAIARGTLARRGAGYAEEVRALLDAALAVMQERGTTRRARVADIVATAGLSNDAFYRHFASKDALVTALLEDGAQRLRGYLEHQMGKARSPEAAVRHWVEGVLSHAGDEIAGTTLAVLFNSGGAGEGMASGRHFASGPLATLLHEPFAQLGSRQPEVAAGFAAHGVLGTLSDHLWQRTRPTHADTERMVELCLAAARV